MSYESVVQQLREFMQEINRMPPEEFEMFEEELDRVLETFKDNRSRKDTEKILKKERLLLKITEKNDLIKKLRREKDQVILQLEEERQILIENLTENC